MITAEEIRKLASLAKLRLTDAEVEKMAKEMSAIVAFADAVSAVPSGHDADGAFAVPGSVPPDAGVDPDGTRPDTVVGSLPREKILKNADGAVDGYFLIKKRK